MLGNGRRTQGILLDRDHAAMGHTASATKDTVAEIRWPGSAIEEPNGTNATAIVAAPPTANKTRPALAAGLSPDAVTMWQIPSAISAAVMIHLSTAYVAASALMVSRVES